jgi:acylphosphatase
VIARRVLVSGRVQGVGYRAFAQRAAVRNGLRGWVRNLRDGRVEAVVVGPEAAVQAFLEQCRRGPPFGSVAGVDVEDASVASFEGFDVRPTA